MGRMEMERDGGMETERWIMERWRDREMEMETG